MASKETNNCAVVRLTVIGDKSSNALNFLLSSLTGAGSASIATPSTHQGSTDGKSHRIVKDMFIDPSLAKRGAKKPNTNPNTRRSRKEQPVRLVLTAERPSDNLDFELIRSRSDAVFFLFDLCCWDSLQYAIDQSHKWNEALPATILHGPHHDDSGSLLFLVGNGSYNVNDNEIEKLNKREMQELDRKHKDIAHHYKMKYFEVSSTSGHNMSRCISTAIALVLKSNKSKKK